MKQKTLYIFLLLFGTIFLPKPLYSQEPDAPTDDLGDVSDAFQENFFEALKQKGIENYELALEALKKAEKAAKSDPKLEAVIYFERGKNQKELKQYNEAQESLNKSLQLGGDRLDVLEELYDVYFRQSDYEKAIPLVLKLIPFDDDYKEDLANLYSRNREYDKALAILDELDTQWGESDYRDALRGEIYRITKNTSGQIERLEEKVEGNPKSEKEALNLIFLYSEQDNPQKAFEKAKDLLQNNPKSQLVHLALYKFYLDEGNAAESLRSMKIVFASAQIDKETKYKVLADFIQFVNTHPEYETELENVVALFSEENSALVYQKLGEYYIAKNNKEYALKFYELGISNDSDNYNLLKNTLLLQIDFKKYDAAAQLSKNALEVFPAQPLLYLLNGVANNGLKMADTAIESLEMGLDFLLEDPKMERDFYEQLKEAYTQKGDSKKASQFAKKATEIKLTN